MTTRATALRWARRAIGALLAVSALSMVIVLMVVPQVIGGAALTILSGSMTPTYPVGSVVIVQPVAPEDVEVGDVITYTTATSLTTHRVVDIGEDESGAPTFTTQGDANRGVDKDPVLAEAVRGRALFHVPYLGRLRDAVASPAGLVAIAAAALVVAGWDRARSLLRKKRSVRPQAVNISDRPDEERTSQGPGSIQQPTGGINPSSWPAAVHQQRLLVAWIAVSPHQRGQIRDVLTLTRGHVVALSAEHIVVAATGTSEHLDAVEELLRPCGRLIAAQRSAPVAPQVSLPQTTSGFVVPGAELSRRPSLVAANGHGTRSV